MDPSRSVLKKKKKEEVMCQRQQGDIQMEGVSTIPSSATPIKAEGGMFIIAHGESGNRHVITAAPGIELFDDEGTLYLRAPIGTPMIHEGPSRHHLPVLTDPITKIDRVREKDHLTDMVRPVQD